MGRRGQEVHINEIVLVKIWKVEPYIFKWIINLFWNVKYTFYSLFLCLIRNTIWLNTTLTLMHPTWSLGNLPRMMNFIKSRENIYSWKCSNIWSLKTVGQKTSPSYFVSWNLWTLMGDKLELAYIFCWVDIVTSVWSFLNNDTWDEF